MTVALNIRYHFIEQYEAILLPMKGIRSRNFKIATKTDYDHGECECILVVDHNNRIDNREPICKEYKFIPNTTIRIVLASTYKYVLGTIGAIVTMKKKL